MKNRIRRLAVVCSLMLGLTSMPVGTLYAEDITDASTEAVENNDESAECVMNPDMVGNADLPQDVDVDYEDDPEAGRANGVISEDFYNEEDLYGIAACSDLTGSAGIVHNSKFNGTTKRSGIDVSSYQEDIDWNQVKASGVEYAIIRMAYRGYSSGSLAKDRNGLKNLKEAKAAGLKVGVYIFSQAITVAEAQEEADYVINEISSYSLDLPIVMDYEYAAGNDGRLYNAHLSVDAATSIVNAFCERVHNKGYYGMLYANKSMLENQLNASDISSKYLVWLANYTNETKYAGNYRFWQYTSTGAVAGINGNVDMNVWYDNGSLMGGGFDSNIDVNYTTHIQNIGWQNPVSNGVIAGSTGRALRLEGIKISLGETPCTGGITYSTHVQGIGWQNFVSDGQLAGTTGKSARLEAIKIALTGEMAKKYDVYYRVHAQSFGWLGWTKNGAVAGTEGYGYRLEAIQILIVDKNAAAPGSTANPNYYTKVRYTSHVQDEGWLQTVKDGAVSGTTGKKLLMEAMTINLDNQRYEGGIQYLAHIQNIGWEQGWRQDGQMVGTSGQSARLEAIKIQLTGEMANHYDVYYRVHAQNIGWMGWAKNGAAAGTEEYSYRLEAIQIVLVDKGGSAPGSTNDAFRKR